MTTWRFRTTAANQEEDEQDDTAIRNGMHSFDNALKTVLCDGLFMDDCIRKLYLFLNDNDKNNKPIGAILGEILARAKKKTLVFQHYDILLLLFKFCESLAQLFLSACASLTIKENDNVNIANSIFKELAALSPHSSVEKQHVESYLDWCNSPNQQRILMKKALISRVLSYLLFDFFQVCDDASPVEQRQVCDDASPVEQRQVCDDASPSSDAVHVEQRRQVCDETLRSCDPCRPSQVCDDASPVEQRQAFDDVSPSSDAVLAEQRRQACKEHYDKHKEKEQLLTKIFFILSQK